MRRSRRSRAKRGGSRTKRGERMLAPASNHGGYGRRLRPGLSADHRKARLARARAREKDRRAACRDVPYPGSTWEQHRRPQFRHDVYQARRVTTLADRITVDPVQCGRPVYPWLAHPCQRCAGSIRCWDSRQKQILTEMPDLEAEDLQVSLRFVFRRSSAQGQ